MTRLAYLSVRSVRDTHLAANQVRYSRAYLRTRTTPRTVHPKNFKREKVGED